MKRGTIAAKALTLLLAVGMLSQNVATIYAAEEGEPSGGKQEYTITYEVEDSTQGSVRLNKDDAEQTARTTEPFTVTTDEEGNIAYSEVVGAVAEAADAEQYTFSNWTAGDEVVSTDAS